MPLIMNFLIKLREKYFYLIAIELCLYFAERLIASELLVYFVEGLVRVDFKKGLSQRR